MLPRLVYRIGPYVFGSSVCYRGFQCLVELGFERLDRMSSNEIRRSRQNCGGFRITRTWMMIRDPFERRQRDRRSDRGFVELGFGVTNDLLRIEVRSRAQQGREQRE